MSIKLFILGRPGSGKTTASRYIIEYLRQHFNNWSIVRYNDYDILQELFLREKLFPPKQKRFEAKELGGFDVLDFTVLDEVLRAIEKTVQANSYKKKEELVIIEFARQDYNQAFHLISDSFLRDSYFLFLDSDVKTCIQRVKDRVTVPPTPDNHFVSENILIGYYGKQLIPHTIKTKKGENVAKDRIKIVSNRGELPKFHLKIENFIEYVMADSSSTTEQHPKVRLKQRRIFIGIPNPLFFTFACLKKLPHLKVQLTRLRSPFQSPFKKPDGR